MRNAHLWQPTKFERHGDAWRASRDPRRVSPGSRLTADRIAAAYTRLLSDHARGDLLDLGCGEVPLFQAYRDRVASVTCADWPASVHSDSHLDAEVDLNEPLPWETDSFDTVLLTDVLEHLPYPDRLWAELARVVRPSGTVLVGVPFLYGLHEQPHDFHRYTEHRLRLFCSDHGFELLECHPYGGPADVLGDLLGKMLSRSRYSGWLIGPVVGSIERAGRSRATAVSPLPLGYVLAARLPGGPGSVPTGGSPTGEPA